MSHLKTGEKFKNAKSIIRREILDKLDAEEERSTFGSRGDEQNNPRTSNAKIKLEKDAEWRNKCCNQGLEIMIEKKQKNRRN